MRLLILLAALVAAPATAQSPALLPTPQTVILPFRGELASVPIPANTRVEADGPGARNAALRFVELMRAAGVRLPAPTRVHSRDRPAFRFLVRTGFGAEGYKVNASGGSAAVLASTPEGMLHGAVTVWQLATQPGATGRLATATVIDHPRFAWRGLMLDSARHFQSPAYVRRLLDWMMANKLNRLHWHLVDDQGWRLPVPGWPRLTSVSGWRRPAVAPGAPPLPPVGGFYTEQQIRELVGYAAARGITIVPEIEMPGHALAAIRAYPALGTGVAVPPGTESDWGVFPWLYNTQEPTFRFLQTVLDQTMRLFPSRWIHLGGDEATKEQWRASPAIQTQIRQLGLKDEDALQGWLMARLGRYVTAHGRRMIGWDEILDGGVPADATITSWRGVDGALKAARAGHDAILSPAPTLYLDNRQGTGPAEPPGRGNLIDLAQVLAFEPMPSGLSAAAQRHILGLQANLWTEHVRTEERAAWMTFPRAAAVAEVGWATAPQRDVAGFAHALVPQLDRMRPLGLAAADSLWAVSAATRLTGRNSVTITLSTQSGLPIRYTLDGTTPSAVSPLYRQALPLAPDDRRLRAASFLEARALPGGVDQPVAITDAFTRTSRELTPCSAAVLLDLEDDWPATGPRAHFLMDIFGPCWRWTGAPPARRIAIGVGQVPFNFQVGTDRAKIRFHSPASPAGEFEVRDGCEGPVVATLPLAPAIAHPGVTRLEAPLTPSARGQDLCITYTARGVDPLWAIEHVELLP